MTRPERNRSTRRRRDASVADVAPSHIMVVTPTYNEAENLPRLVAALLALPLDLRILVVDDNSTDGTGRIADRLASVAAGRIRVLHRPSKAGLRSAYLEGFRLAIESGADAVAQMDADFSHDPAVLIQMSARLAGCDLVIGSRYVPGGAVDRDWALWRKALSAFGNIYARLILGFDVRDSTSGYRLWRTETLQAMPLERVAATGYVFQVEMAYLAVGLGFRVCELPIYFPDRRLGRSKMSLGIQAEAAVRVLQVWWQYRDVHRSGGSGAAPT